MKIVSWNCNGAFRRKWRFLSEFEADIYIVQECEDPSFCLDSEYISWATNHIWIGDSKHKGIGIFAKDGIIIEKLDWTNTYEDHSVKHFLPCRINQSFNLLAVWTHQNKSPTHEYIGQFWKYLQLHKSLFQDILLAGDFNSNVFWDKKRRWWNHSDVVRELEEINIKSLYHLFTRENQGEETTPTFYLHRRLEKPYHIDYFFGSSEFCEKLTSFEIGGRDPWLALSDHLPIVCEWTMNI
jgi:exonuclease III